MCVVWLPAPVVGPGTRKVLGKHQEGTEEGSLLLVRIPPLHRLPHTVTGRHAHPRVPAPHTRPGVPPRGCPPQAHTSDVPRFQGPLLSVCQTPLLRLSTAPRPRCRRAGSVSGSVPQVLTAGAQCALNAMPRGAAPPSPLHPPTPGTGVPAHPSYSEPAPQPGTRPRLRNTSSSTTTTTGTSAARLD